VPSLTRQAPLRVLVKGSSSANWVSFMGGPPTDFTYARVVERELLDSGRNVVVRNLSATSERVTTGLKNWERQVYPWSPDVVILNYGLFETVHLFLPQPLERHVNSLRGRPGAIRDNYRRYALRSTWKALAVAQQKIDGRVPPSAAFSRRARRFVDDLTQLISRIQMVGSPLVIVPEIPPPGDRWRTWFPGIEQRIAMMNDALAAAVTRTDRDNVRLFPTSDVLAELTATGHDLVPDGGHFTPQAHEVIGRALAVEIRDWCDANVPL
jgi:lysophospholipase L1-like esterase